MPKMGVDKHFFYVKDLSKKMFLIKLIIKCACTSARILAILSLTTNKPFSFANNDKRINSITSQVKLSNNSKLTAL